MRIFRALFISVLLTIASTAMADDYAYLNIAQSDGGETQFTVSQISKITFDAAHMNVALADGTMQQLPLAGLSKMFFSATPTGIATATLQPSTIRTDGGVLHVSAPQGTVVTLYNMSGQAVHTITAQGDDTQINVSGLTKGVYIVKVGLLTKKIMNR